MKIIYLTAVVAVMIWYLIRSLQRRRQGILIGLVFLIFSGNALPRFLVKTDGPVLSVLELGFVGLAFVAFLSRLNSRLSMKYVLNRYFIALGVLLGLMLIGLFWSHSGYGLDKTVMFAFRCVLPAVALSALAPLNESDVRCIFSTIVIGAILIAVQMFAYGDLSSQRVNVPGGLGPLGIGYSVGRGVILLLMALLLQPHPSLKGTALSVGLLVPMLAAEVVNGSRGPLLGLAVATVAGIVVACTRTDRLRSFGRLAVAMATIASLFVGTGLYNRIVTTTSGSGRVLRTESWLDPQDAQNASRVQLFETAIKAFWDSEGLGLGTGNYALLPTYKSEQYPHNVFLEVAVENGIVGLAVLVYAVLLTLVRTVRVARAFADPYVRAMSVFWLFSIVNACVTSDIGGNPWLWVSMGLPWLIEPLNGAASAIGAVAAAGEVEGNGRLVSGAFAHR